MKYHFRTPPWPHQREALEFLLRHRGGGLQIPMRFGKSKVGVDFAGCMWHLENVRRVLVVTVTSGLGVWEDQIAQHCAVPWMVSDWHGDLLDEEPSEDLYERDKKLQFMLVNFPNLYDRMNTGGRSWTSVPRTSLMKFKPDLIIIDESHHVGNPGSVTFKMAYILGTKARFRVIMTGTMFHRKPFYTFGQMKFLDHGRSLGSDFTVFKKKIAVFGGWGDYEVVRYRNLGWMTKQVKKKVLIKKAPPKIPAVTNVLHFRLTGDNLAAYNKMDKERVLRVGDDVIISQQVMTKHMRMHMIEGGWIRTEGGIYRRVGKNKLVLAQSRIAEYAAQGIEAAVVSCRFTPELADARAAGIQAGYRVILFHGGLTSKERTKRIRVFQQGEEPMLFVAQVQTASQSIDLSRADTLMHYSLSESYLVHDQMNSRIEKYKEKRTLQYDYLVGRATRGAVTMKALELKKDVADLIADNPKLVEKLTRRPDLASAPSVFP